MTMGPPVLEVEDLTVRYEGKQGDCSVLTSVSLQIGKGETMALVGESGCGKTTLALSVMRLLNRRTTVAEGDIRLSGRSLLTLPERHMRRIRGQEISLVFQDPRSAFHPMLTIGTQIAETLRDGLKRDKRAKALRLLERVRLPEPERVLRAYPHELSGGMLQRAMLAMALANGPELLIADEPTTALDTTVQKELLALLRELQSQTGMSILFISHDLAVVAEVADRIAVMADGGIVECGPAGLLLRQPQHRQTKLMLDAVPKLAVQAAAEREAAEVC